MSIFRQLHDGSLEVNKLNHALIVLIPKCEGASTTKDFRPISLFNSHFKIITEVIANRLKGPLTLMIDESQMAFLKGRSMLQSVATAQEIISACHHRGWEGFLELDFEKAFDSIGWRFIFDTLKARGFPAPFIRWIEIYLKNATSAVIIKGEIGPHFVCNRGLRQGDPLSPLPFILRVDVLAKILQRATHAGFIQRVRNFDTTPNFSCLQYADDTLLIAPMTPPRFATSKSS